MFAGLEYGFGDRLSRRNCRVESEASKMYHTKGTCSTQISAPKGFDLSYLLKSHLNDRMQSNVRFPKPTGTDMITEVLLRATPA